MVRLDSVRRAWSAEPAVDDLSLAVDPGEFVILLGPSGCGKSTTLRLIAGLESPDAGRIHINGEDVTDRPPQQRGLSMVFQSYALFPHLTVAENIVFGLRSRRVARARRQQRLKQVAELVGLDDLLDRKPAQLSGGQRQRVALARAIVAEHTLCLMDEPLSNLDARLRGEMRREIRDLQQRLGMTVVYVTHDQIEAMSMGDRIVLLEHGRIVQHDSPEQIYQQPASAFAASFIGSPPMNLIDLEHTAHGPIIPGVPDQPVAAPRVSDPITLGVRPEAIRVSAAPEESPGLPARITDTEYLGSEVIVGIQVGDQRLVAKVSALPNDLSIGAPCRLQWDTDAAHLFAGTTGERISASGGDADPVSRL